MGATAYIEANGLHSAPDAMASEFEVQEFLYSLVRLLKPEVLIETGCYMGHATEAIVSALTKNRSGHLTTCDTNFVHHEVTALSNAAYRDYVEVLHCDGVEAISGLSSPVDFAFLDSSGDRVAEAAALQLSPKAVVVVHDTNRPQYDAIKLLHPWKSVWKIETPRGLTVFQL